MALVQAINTGQIQSKIDEFAHKFMELEELAQDLLALRVEVQNNNNHTDGLLLGFDNLPMSATIRTELVARLGALNSFVNYANTGTPSPLAYLRGVKRVV